VLSFLSEAREASGNETTRVHHAAWRRGGILAAPGACTAAGEAADNRASSATTPAAWSLFIAAFVRRLRELGWIEGRTIAIEYRWAGGRGERFDEIAAEFVRLKVDVIVTAGGAVLAAKQATSLIPRSSLRRQRTRSAAAWSRANRARRATAPGSAAAKLPAG
jgi:hypothetical protein